MGMEGHRYKLLIPLGACLLASAIVLQGCGGGKPPPGPVDDYDEDEEEPVCCHAMTASCLACKKKMSKEKYCRKHPDTDGCPDDEPVCCHAMTATCEACKKKMSVPHFCAKHPHFDGCGETVCCQAETAACLACKKGVPEFEYCFDHPDTPGCTNKECPSWTPRKDGECIRDGTTCSYDLMTCPDGSKHHTTVAHCHDGNWKVAKYLVECADTCPKDLPEGGSHCSKKMSSKETCDYDKITCPDGSVHATSFASCSDNKWMIVMSMIVCPDDHSSRLFDAKIHVGGTQISMPFVLGASASLVAGALLLFVIRKVVRRTQPGTDTVELLPVSPSASREVDACEPGIE